MELESHMLQIDRDAEAIVSSGMGSRKIFEQNPIDFHFLLKFSMDSLRQTTKYHPPAIKDWHSYFSDNLILLWERRYNFRFLIVMKFREKKKNTNYQYSLSGQSLPHGSVLDLQAQNKNISLDSLQNWNSCFAHQQVINEVLAMTLPQDQQERSSLDHCNSLLTQQ